MVERPPRGFPRGEAVSGRTDIVDLYAARAARGFGDGFATTMAVGFLAPRYHLRTLLLACAALMVLTGVAIPSLQHLIFIAFVAFIGTMNPTTGDIGVHVPLEQAAIAHRALDAERTHIFARYSLIGALSIAAGALAAGAPDLLVSLHLSRSGALQAMFYLYAALGLI